MPGGNLSVVILSIVIVILCAIYEDHVEQRAKLAEAEATLREDVQLYFAQTKELNDAKARIAILEACDRGWPKLEYRNRLRAYLDAEAQYQKAHSGVAHLTAVEVLKSAKARVEELFTPFDQRSTECTVPLRQGGDVVGQTPISPVSRKDYDWPVGMTNEMKLRPCVCPPNGGCAGGPPCDGVRKPLVAPEGYVQNTIPLCAKPDCDVCKAAA
jgi:hypothetical protein